MISKSNGDLLGHQLKLPAAPFSANQQKFDRSSKLYLV